jgi:two-component system, NtrC family, sensor kinase
MTKILLVDDEVSILNLLKMSLELDGYEVFTAENGYLALAIFKKENPDIAIIDAKMPDMDGIELLGNLKSLKPETEVIMITGHGDMDMAIECLRKEASNFLTKPVSEELLSLSIKRSIEKLGLKRKLKKYTKNLEILVREANDELERAYKFRENIIENSPDAIVSVKRGGEIVIFNSAAEKLLGHSKDNVVGKMNIVDLYPPGVAKQIMKDLRSEDFGGKGILQKREVEILHKDGRPIPVYISASILYEGFQESGSVGIFTDLTEKKKLQKQLIRSEKLSALGQLSAGIAHEINQPLTGVLTFASLLLKKFQDDEQTRKDLEIIVSETQRIRKIVHGVLDFARETPVQKKPCSINEVIEKTLAIIVRQERFLGILLTTDLESALPPVLVDENLMRQVFMNLALNGIDSMKGKGTLTVRTRKINNYVEVDFSDTGSGISEDIMEKIFDPFFSTKSSSEGSGLGLGLSVSYGIVRNHNGEIMVSSVPGQGATFTVRIPVKDQ